MPSSVYACQELSNNRREKNKWKLKPQLDNTTFNITYKANKIILGSGEMCAFMI